MEVKVTFSYLNKAFDVLCKSTDKMDNMFGKFVSKLGDGSESNHYIYYYDGHKLGHNSTIEKDKYLSQNLNNNINITAQKKLRIIKCPNCRCNDCIINLNNFVASYYGCKYDHSSSSIYDHYINIQKIENSDIRCLEPGCPHNQQNYSLGIYKCLTCTKIIKKRSQYYCKEHISSHNEHTTVKYDKKNYYCEKHFKKFIKYCFTCHQNLCEDCEKQHQGDKIAAYDLMTPNADKLKDSLAEMEKKIDTLKVVINNIITSLNDTLIIFKRYHYIAKDIIGKFELFNQDLKNNRILKSLWNLQYSNTIMNDELDKIIDEDDQVKKANVLLTLYENNEVIYEKNTSDIIGKIDYKKEDDDWWKEIKGIKDEKKKVVVIQKETKNQNQNQNTKNSVKKKNDRNKNVYE